MPAPVPELLAKKRSRDEAWGAKKAAEALEAKKKARSVRAEQFKRAESYVKEYRQQVRGGWQRRRGAPLPAATPAGSSRPRPGCLSLA
jgi:hypothetical protein